MQAAGVKVKTRKPEVLNGTMLNHKPPNFPETYPSRGVWAPSSDLALFFSFSLLSNL